MTGIEDRIAAHPVANTVDNFRRTQLAARHYGPGGDAAVAAFGAALAAALDADDQRQASVLALARGIRRSLDA